MYALHTAINPVIYSIIDRKFRRNIYYMLLKRRRRKSFTATTTTAINISPVHPMNVIRTPPAPTATCSPVPTILIDSGVDAGSSVGSMESQSVCTSSLLGSQCVSWTSSRIDGEEIYPSQITDDDINHLEIQQ